MSYKISLSLIDRISMLPSKHRPVVYDLQDANLLNKLSKMPIKDFLKKIEELYKQTHAN